MTTLYRINKEIEECIFSLDLATSPEEETAILENLKCLKLSEEEKLGNCCAYLKNLEAHEDMIDSEIERLANKRDAIRSRKNSFKRYMSQLIDPGTKWSNGLHSIGWRASESVEILDESLIPEQYMREKITRSPDKTEIKNHIKIGATIPGAELKQSNNIQIK